MLGGPFFLDALKSYGHNTPFLYLLSIGAVAPKEALIFPITRSPRSHFISDCQRPFDFWDLWFGYFRQTLSPECFGTLWYQSGRICWCLCMTISLHLFQNPCRSTSDDVRSSVRYLCSYLPTSTKAMRIVLLDFLSAVNSVPRSAQVHGPDAFNSPRLVLTLWVDNFAKWTQSVRLGWELQIRWLILRLCIMPFYYLTGFDFLEVISRRLCYPFPGHFWIWLILRLFWHLIFSLRFIFVWATSSQTELLCSTLALIPLG